MSIYNKLLLFSKEPSRQDELFIEIVSDIKPLIKKYVNLVDKSMQDDFEQLILLKIFDILEMKKFKVEIFKNIEFNGKMILEFINKLDEPLLGKYINNSSSNKAIYEKRLISEKFFFDFIDSFTLFFGDVKIIKFFDISFCNLRIDFLRKCKNDINMILDDKICDGYEIIEEDKNKFSIDSLQGVSDKDKKFLHLFIKDNKLLTQKEVAISLGVVPQSISKKMNKIKRKVRKYN